MTAEVARAHAEHLKTLINYARDCLAKGNAIPQDMWEAIDKNLDKVIEAIPKH